MVIDTNILFSALIGNEKCIDVILNYEVFAPKFLLAEVFKHKEKINKYSNRDINMFIFNILSEIMIIDERFIPLKIRQEAKRLCKDIDIKDSPFVALSLFLDKPLLTGDKKLIEGLKKRGFENIMELKDIG